MKPLELRRAVVAELLQADGPADLAALAQRCGVPGTHILPHLRTLVSERQVVAGRLAPGSAGVHYRWAARWEEELRAATSRARDELRAFVGEGEPGVRPDIDGPAAGAFVSYVTERYTPPRDKRTLVFLQCSVRRPFSSSPSHAFMRRAIRTATGFGPAEDFERCPVHVVVLASRLGPVPYEFENVFPANVRGGGVKHFRPETYARVAPVLVQRMADYMAAHGDSYDHMATFTEGRYGEVMSAAARTAAEISGHAIDLAVLPTRGGARVLRAGRSTPRTYWQKYWIQLYLKLVDWLDATERPAAEQRLRALEVEFAEE